LFREVIMKFEAIVIGGGHAGVEATRALSSMGAQVALITLDERKVGAMSCNPAIGGVAKSHLVFEVDALGGIMGAAADATGIQSRRLNLNKGPAVRSTRVQCDKARYQSLVSDWIAGLPGVTVVRAEAKEVLSVNGRVTGVLLQDGSSVEARAVVVTSGTFMGGLLFCGDIRERGGRFGDNASEGLSESIYRLGHGRARLKTGTPARLKAETIDFSQWSPQWGDPERRTFSWRSSHGNKLPQLSCYIGFTSEKTHDVIRRNFHRSPLFSGDIVGIGPRYCPSVEDKVRRFADRDRHQIFLEPEGLDTNSIYPNGMSTSLPADVQLEFLRTIAGLERVELLRPGYAVEYDVFDPRELTGGFQSKFCSGLFIGGQVNRTSGYEEAAAQGLWAGLQAGRFLRDLPEALPDRSRSYLETLVDDLTTKGSEEPYRMFTSRSEFRLLLREDNAHERMRGLALENGLILAEQVDWFESVSRETAALAARLSSERIRIDEDRVISLREYLKRPEVNWETLVLQRDDLPSDLAIEKVEIEAKYAGYLQKQANELKEYQLLQEWLLPETLNLRDIPALSKEVVEKVERHRPRTIRELASISGVTPAAVIAIGRSQGFKRAALPS
jgi:tRNA uridine 5-carboxymethylaminomethyl modification enzyme